MPKLVVKQCQDCRKRFKVPESSQQKYCEKCLSARRAKGPANQKGIPKGYSENTTLLCWECGTPFHKKPTSERTLCTKCRNKIRAKGFKNLWNTPGYREEHTQRQRKLMEENLYMRETCKVCGCLKDLVGVSIKEIETPDSPKPIYVIHGYVQCCGENQPHDIPVTKYCRKCKAPLPVKSWSSINFCEGCLEKEQELKFKREGEALIDFLELSSEDTPEDTIEKLFANRDRLYRYFKKMAERRNKQ